MSSKPSNLVDEKLAVSLFLDSLLRETEDITVEDAAEEVADVTKVANVVEVAKTAVDSPEIDTNTEVQVEAAAQHKVEKTDEVEQQEQTLTNSTAPEWASEPFQILLFEVAGLKLAVPLVELSGVIEWKDNVTEMPGSADFYMGILQHLNHRIAVIDTAKMVLPINKQSELIGDDPRERVKHIVLIDDYRWGLACDKIGEVITLQPDEVRWRASNASRTWLAGTVIDHMCALLNSKAFAVMLKKGQSAENLA